MKKIHDATILYIEDDIIAKEQFSQFLKSRCQILYTASDGEEGFELFKKFEPDIVITDIKMPKINGLEMIKKIREVSWSTQIIIISAYTKPEYLLEAVSLQLIQYLVKPVSLEKITSALKLASNFLECKEIKSKKTFSKSRYYDTCAKELISNNQIINLSKHERALLELLIKECPLPISYQIIDANIYNYTSSKNAIKLLVSSLRDKISKEAIINISGFGYKLKLKE